MKVYLKKPSGRRISYSIYSRVEKDDGRTENHTLECPELEALNQNLFTLPADIAFKNAMEIKKIVEKRMGLSKGVVVFNSDNERILEQYWDKKYSSRNLIDPYTAKMKYRRAIAALGNLSLLTASGQEINKAINNGRNSNGTSFDRNKKRSLLTHLKRLLLHLKRDVVLEIPREEKIQIKYMDERDFLAKLSKIKDEHLKTLFYVLYYTGMRLGEAFSITKFKLRPNQGFIIVDTQLDKNNKTRLPKWEKTRKAFVRSHTFDHIEKWIDLRSTFPYSRIAANKTFKKYFGKDVTIHDLRHFYAITLITKGVSMTHVAQSLGNAVQVCEKYYVGYVLVDESIELMRKTVGD